MQRLLSSPLAFLRSLKRASMTFFPGVQLVLADPIVDLVLLHAIDLLLARRGDFLGVQPLASGLVVVGAAWDDELVKVHVRERLLAHGCNHVGVAEQAVGALVVVCPASADPGVVVGLGALWRLRRDVEAWVLPVHGRSRSRSALEVGTVPHESSLASARAR